MASSDRKNSQRVLTTGFSSNITYIPLKKTDYSNGGFSFNNKMFDRLEKIERSYDASPFAKKLSYISVLEKNKFLLKLSMNEKLALDKPILVNSE